MSFTPRTAARWLICAVAFTLCPGLAVAQENAPNVRRLPQGTVAFFTIRNVAEFKKRFGESMFGRMLHDPALQPFLNEVHGKLAEGIQHFESEAGFGVDELLSVPQGEVSVGVTLGPTAGQFGMIAFVDFSGKDESFQRVMGRMTRAMDEQGVKRVEEEIEGTPAVLIQAPEAPQTVKVAPAYCIKGTTFVITSHVDTLRAVLSRWDGQHTETLGDNDVFRYISDRCQNAGTETAPLATWFIDPLTMVRGALSVDPNMAFQAAMAMGIVQQVGIDKLKGIGGTMDIGQGDFDSISHTFIYMEASPRSVLNIAQFDEGALGPPRWISSNADSFSSTRWNIEKAYDTVESLVDMFRGPGSTAKALDEFSQNAELGRIHVKRDLIDQFTGTLQSFSDQVGEGESARQRMLFSLELRNPNAMKGVLTRIAAIDGFPGTQREFQGETIYEFSVPAGMLDNIPGLTRLQFGDAPEDGEATMGLSVAEGRLLFAIDVTVLEQVIRGAGDHEPLAESAVYKKVAERFPARAASISFSRDDQQVKSALEMLKSGPVGQALANQMNIDIDLTKLPDFDAIKKYTAPSGGYMEVDTNGLRWTNFTLKGAD